MINLRSIIKRFDRLMAAVTFAEAGESKTALEIMSQRPRKEGRNRLQSTLRKRTEKRPRLRIE